MYCDIIPISASLQEVAAAREREREAAGSEGREPGEDPHPAPGNPPRGDGELPEQGSTSAAADTTRSPSPQGTQTYNALCESRLIRKIYTKQNSFELTEFQIKRADSIAEIGDEFVRLSGIWDLAHSNKSGPTHI